MCGLCVALFVKSSQLFALSLCESLRVWSLSTKLSFFCCHHLFLVLESVEFGIFNLEPSKKELLLGGSSVMTGYQGITQSPSTWCPFSSIWDAASVFCEKMLFSVWARFGQLLPSIKKQSYSGHPCGRELSTENLKPLDEPQIRTGRRCSRMWFLWHLSLPNSAWWKPENTPLRRGPADRCWSRATTIGNPLKKWMILLNWETLYRNSFSFLTPLTLVVINEVGHSGTHLGKTFSCFDWENGLWFALSLLSFASCCEFCY